MEMSTIGYLLVALEGFRLQHDGVDLIVLQVILLGRGFLPPFTRCKRLSLIQSDSPTGGHLNIVSHGLLLESGLLQRI